MNLDYIFRTLVYITTVTVIQNHGYVLLAANMEDFRTLAKKLVPEPLADQLADLAAKSGLNYRQVEESLSESDSTSDDHAREDSSQDKEVKGMRFAKINFDELVQKVKERIDKDSYKKSEVLPKKKNDQYNEEEPKSISHLGNKAKVTPNEQNDPEDNEAEEQAPISYFGNKQRNKQYDDNEPEYSEETKSAPVGHHGNKFKVIKNARNPPEYSEEREPPEPKVIQKETQNPEYREEEDKQGAQLSHLVNNEKKITTREPKLKRKGKRPISKPDKHDGMIFSKIEMNGKDSYEDYVTPKKEDDIFESNDAEKLDDIPTRTQNEPPENQDTDSLIQYDDKTEEFRGQTGDLWYEDKQTNVTEHDTAEDTTPMKSIKSTTRKTSKGTMIPKRDFYKMSSPNYFAKVPIVAEKYDFNEPIPRKDQEPENLKPIKGLPLALINGKVRIRDPVGDT